jgi:hypothetical protein
MGAKYQCGVGQVEATCSYNEKDLGNPYSNPDGHTRIGRLTTKEQKLTQSAEPVISLIAGPKESK